MSTAPLSFLLHSVSISKGGSKQPSVFFVSHFLLFSSGFGSVWFGSVWFGSVWFGSVWFGLVRFGSVRFGSVRFGSVRFGSVRPNLLLFFFCEFRFEKLVLSNQMVPGLNYLITFVENEEKKYYSIENMKFLISKITKVCLSPLLIPP